MEPEHDWLTRIRDFVKNKRRFFAGRATVFVGISCLILAFLIIGTDVLVGFPSTTRWVSFLFLVGSAVAGLVIRFLLPSVRFRSPEAIREIERERTDLGQMLRTSAQLSQTPEPERNGVSPVFARALQQQAGQELARTDLQGLIPWQAVRRATLLLVALAVVFAAAALLWADFRIGMQRLVMPAAEVTFTRLSVTVSADYFERGESVFVQARTSGRPVRGAALLTRGKDREWTATAMIPGEAGDFVSEISGWTESFDVRVKAGDARSPATTVRFVDPPVIQSVTVQLRYPEYTGMTPRDVDVHEIVAVEGTYADLEFQLNHPLANAEFSIDGGDTGVELDGSAVRVSHQLALGKIECFLHGRDEEGWDLKRMTVAMEGVEDRLPEIRFLQPKEDIEVTKLTEVPVQVQVRDDFGIMETGIVLVVDGQEEIVARQAAEKPTLLSLRNAAELLLEHHPLSIRSNVRIYAYARDWHPDREGRAVTNLVAIDIKPLKVRFRAQQEEQADGGMSEPQREQLQEDAAKLEEAVKQQREVLSRTFGMREEGRRPQQALEGMARQEDALAEQMQEIGQNLAALSLEEDQQVLQEAARQLAQAAEELQRPDLDTAFEREDEALTNMLKTRNEMVRQLQQTQQPQDQQQGQQEQQTAHQEQEQAEDALSDLAREAERLAGEEQDVGEQVAQQQAQAEQQADAQQQDTQQQTQAEQQADAQQQDTQQQAQAAQQADAQQQSQAEQQALGQQEAAARDGSELLDMLRQHPQRTDLAQERMAAAEQQMREAEETMRNRELANAGDALEQARQQLAELGEHLRGLDLAHLAETLDRAREKAEQAAAQLTQPQPQLPARSQQGEQQQSQAELRQQAQQPGQRQGGTPSEAREQIAADAETVSDWMQQMARQPLTGLEKMQERLEQAREELAVDELADDVRHSQQQQDRGRPAESQAIAQDAAERFEQLAETLDRETRRLVQDHLERLATAEAETEDLKSELEQQTQAQTAANEEARPNNQGGSPRKLAQRLDDLAEELQDLNDETLEELGEQLMEQVGPQNVTGDPLRGKVVPQLITETTLTPTADRLRQLIDDIVRKEILLNRDERVPDAYGRLVERYFQALSDDLRE